MVVTSYFKTITFILVTFFKKNTACCSSTAPYFLLYLNQHFKATLTQVHFLFTLPNSSNKLNKQAKNLCETYLVYVKDTKLFSKMFTFLPVVALCWGSTFWRSGEHSVHWNANELRSCCLPQNCRRLNSTDKLYRNGPLIFQIHLAMVPSTYDHIITLLDWPANSPDVIPINKLWRTVKRKMRQKTQECSQTEGCYQNNLGFINIGQWNPSIPNHFTTVINANQVWVSLFALY